MIKHLAIFKTEDAKKIFSGKRKIEGRFSKIKIPPFGVVSAGDKVLIKTPGEKILGEFSVDRIIYFDHPTAAEILEVKRKYKRGLAIDEKFWLTREKINYITLMFIKSVNKFIIAPEVSKKDLRPWVVLT